MDTTTDADVLWTSEKNGGGHIEVGSCDTKTLINDAYESCDYDVFETSNDIEELFDDEDERSLEAKKLLPCVGYRLYETDDYQLVPKAEMSELDWAIEVFREKQEGKGRNLNIYRSAAEAYKSSCAMKCEADEKMMSHLCRYHCEDVAKMSGIEAISYIVDDEGYEDDGQTFYDFLRILGDKHIAGPAASPEELLGEPATYEDLKKLNLLWLLHDPSDAEQNISMGKLITDWHIVSKEY